MAYGTEAERLDYAFRRVGARPAPEEVRDARQFLTAARAVLAGTAMPEDRKSREALAS